MPRPRPGEDKESYVSRFMASEEAKRDYPDQKQRAAVAYSMFGEKKNNTQICESCGAEMTMSPDALVQACGACGHRLLGKQEMLSAKDLTSMCPTCTHNAAGDHDEIGCTVPGCECLQTAAALADPRPVQEKKNAGDEEKWKDQSDYNADGGCKKCGWGAPGSGHTSGYHKDSCPVLKKERAKFEHLQGAERRNATGGRAAFEDHCLGCEACNAAYNAEPPSYEKMCSMGKELVAGKAEDAAEITMLADGIKHEAAEIAAENRKISESKIGPEIAHHERDENMPPKQAIAAAFSESRQSLKNAGVEKTMQAFEAHAKSCPACRKVYAAPHPDADKLCAEGQKLLYSDIDNADDKGPYNEPNVLGCNGCDDIKAPLNRFGYCKACAAKQGPLQNADDSCARCAHPKADHAGGINKCKAPCPCPLWIPGKENANDQNADPQVYGDLQAVKAELKQLITAYGGLSQAPQEARDRWRRLEAMKDNLELMLMERANGSIIGDLDPKDPNNLEPSMARLWDQASVGERKRTLMVAGYSETSGMATKRWAELPSDVRIRIKREVFEMENRNSAPALMSEREALGQSRYGSARA